MALCVGDAARGLPEHFQLEAFIADERVSILKAKNLESGLLCHCTVYSKASLGDNGDLKALLQAGAAAQGCICDNQQSTLQVPDCAKTRLASSVSCRVSGTTRL